jgi:hypothetical protein
VAQSKVAAWGFVVAGVLFLAAAILPVLLGGTLNPRFVALAVFFIIIGAAARTRRAMGAGPRDGQRPARPNTRLR